MTQPEPFAEAAPSKGTPKDKRLAANKPKAEAAKAAPSKTAAKPAAKPTPKKGGGFVPFTKKK